LLRWNHSASCSKEGALTRSFCASSQGVIIPEPMRKYMGGRDFLPYVRELPVKAAEKPSKKKH